MRKILFLAFLVIACYSCSTENDSLTNVVPDSHTRYGPQPSTDCGVMTCNFTDISATDYTDLCEYNDALIAQFNNCSFTLDFSETCVSVVNPINQFTKTDRGFDADLFVNFDLLDYFVDNSWTGGNVGPICSYGLDPWGDCWLDIPTTSLSLSCGASAGWTVSAADLQAYAQFAYNASCSLAGTSCGVGYELNLGGIEFSIGDLTGCSDCNWEYCASTGTYYPSTNCGGYNIIFTASYYCCAID